jgi:uncharacterized protein YceK
MIKNISKLSLIIFITFALSGCASVKSPVVGLAYTEVKAPFAVTSNQGASKVGTAEAQSVLGLVATGDASIQTAAESAGITRIHHVDYESTSILGIIATFKVIVYGE